MFQKIVSTTFTTNEKARPTLTQRAEKKLNCSRSSEEWPSEGRNRNERCTYRQYELQIRFKSHKTPDLTPFPAALKSWTSLHLNTLLYALANRPCSESV